MYWQKRFDRENPDIELEEKIHEIHKCNIRLWLPSHVW